MNAVLRQTCRPEGPLGVAVADLMDQFNANVFEQACDLLWPAQPRNVLEVGFGGGGFQVKLQMRRSVNWVGVEISETLVRDFVEANPFKGDWANKMPSWVEAVLACAEALPLRAAAFDAAVMLNVLHLIEDKALVCAELARVVRPCGQLVLGLVGVPDCNLRGLLLAAGFARVEGRSFVDHISLGKFDLHRRYTLVSATRA